MGVHRNITADSFPKQGLLMGQRVDVCFHYNTLKKVGGVVVRDDLDDPHLTVIKLDDGRYVLGAECQYSTDTFMAEDAPKISYVPLTRVLALHLNEAITTSRAIELIRQLAAGADIDPQLDDLITRYES